MRARCESALVESGICIRRYFPAIYGSREEHKLRHDWHIIGRLEDGPPFLLMYSGCGMTNWFCSANLGDSLRKKILDKVRTDLRRADTPPSYITVHDLTGEADWQVANSRAEQLSLSFFKTAWRSGTLNDRDEDYISLAVPFAEKDEAKALGAKWDGQAKAWKVKLQADMTPFARWLPAKASITN
ncbi:MAG TPA: DUF5710 domain-containing protein [Candidatus Binatia bacterium]|nr:DUF5710 domain-containing protein [Candidatus Binatia bacterium]